MARPLGADVAFFLTGGTALGLGRGDEIYPLADLPSHHVVVAWPGHGVSTVDAYRWFTEFHARRRAGADGNGHAGGWDPERLEASGNDLEGPVEAHRPEIRKIRRTLASCGARVAQMSGSGSAVFGLFESKAKAERACSAVKAGRVGRRFDPHACPGPAGRIKSTFCTAAVGPLQRVWFYPESGIRSPESALDRFNGAWPSGKARDFESRIRRFESFRPNHLCSRRMNSPRLTQPAEARVRQSRGLD